MNQQPDATSRPPKQKPLDLTRTTPWFPKGTRPVRIGYYERCFVDGIFMNWWDGRRWLVEKGGTPHWRNWQDYPQWRGLEVNPYAFQAHRDRCAFEQWLPTIKGERPDVERTGQHGVHDPVRGDGDYRSIDTQNLWRAWRSGQFSPYRERA